MPDETTEKKRYWKCVCPIDGELTLGKVYEGHLSFTGLAVYVTDDEGSELMYYFTSRFVEVAAPAPLPPAKTTAWKEGDEVFSQKHGSEVFILDGETVTGRWWAHSKSRDLSTILSPDVISPAHPEPQKEAESCVNQNANQLTQTEPCKPELLQRWSPHPHAQDGKCVICDEVKHRNAAGCCLDCYEVPKVETELERMRRVENMLIIGRGVWHTEYRAFLK